LAVIHRDQYELERVSTWDAMGMRGTCSHGYRLKAAAPIEQVLPKPFADIAAESMVAVSHLLWSSVWCGVAADALGRAQAYVTSQARAGAGSPPHGVGRLAEAYANVRMLQALIKEWLSEWEAARAQPTLSVSLGVNALKVSVSTGALQIVEDCLMICGLQGYKNGGPYSLGRHLRDIHSARLMIGNDRILASTGQMLLMQRRPSKGASA
jgi:acyl-CoA dehydrogenase